MALSKALYLIAAALSIMNVLRRTGQNGAARPHGTSDRSKSMASKVLILARDADDFAAHLRRRFADVVFVTAMHASDAPALWADCDVLMTRNDDCTDTVIRAMPRLRFIQALTTGTELIEAIPDIPRDAIIAAARGFHGPQMSELAFLFMLAFARNIRGIIADQSEHRWNRVPQRLLAGKTVVVLGVGRIAEEIARRAKVFDMRVLGVSASRTAVTGFDAIHPRSRMTEAVAQADYLIVLAPATKDNQNLVDAAVLRAMKPTAVLINIARGGVVDETALLAALREKRIAGAGLDVFVTEPLPADHPLWSLDNVLITSHIGGMSDNYAEQVMPIVVDNLAAYLAGTPSLMRYIIRPPQGMTT
jgi:phosphoglycerate dehydrogenase-like enzyme